MTSVSASNKNLVGKEINLLKDTHRKVEKKQQLAVIYRSIAIVFAFGFVLLGSTWGWTQYEIRKVEGLRNDLDTKKYELSQYKPVIDTVNMYKKRLYEIKNVGLGQTPDVLTLYRDLSDLEKKNEMKLKDFKINGIKFSATYDVGNLYTTKELLEQLESSDMKKKWRNVVVNEVSRSIPNLIVIEIKGDLISKRN